MPEQNVTLKSHPEKNNKIHLPKNEVKTSLSKVWSKKNRTHTEMCFY